jgi:hypothetical protein
VLSKSNFIAKLEWQEKNVKVLFDKNDLSQKQNAVCIAQSLLPMPVPVENVYSLPLKTLDAEILATLSQLEASNL